MGTEFTCIQGGSAGSRGWSIFGFDYASTMPTAIAAMKSWRINAVRVPLNEDCWLGINGPNPAYAGASYVGAISKYVRDLRAAGIWVILDLHWNAPADVPAAAQQPMPDADHAPTFWQSVADTFKNDPGVMFDLYNEPFLYTSYIADPAEAPWTCWLKGCNLNRYLTGQGGDDYTHERVWRAAGMQELVDAVRATGATQPIIVSGLNWANDLSGWLAHRPSDKLGRIVAGWHNYGGEMCASTDCWDTDVSAVAARVPVVTGEFGDNCSERWVSEFLPWADAHNLSYLAWTFNPSTSCNDILIRNWSGAPTAGYGEYVRAHYLSRAGT
jgi:hypothetical protein